MKQLDLGKEKIGKLLLSFSVPCIISLVVNALYNMVDQIFIGWGVGYLGNVFCVNAWRWSICVFKLKVRRK